MAIVARFETGDENGGLEANGHDLEHPSTLRDP